jgi:thiosulfate reductase cytochrome b subunit
MHWIGATSIICMMLSGWAIYNASPSLPFTFPGWLEIFWDAGSVSQQSPSNDRDGFRIGGRS